MKKIFFLLIILSSIISAQNVKVSDYNVALSYASNFIVNGFWNWSQVGDSVSGNTANANFTFRRFFSSLPFAWDFAIDFSGSKDKNKHSYNGFFDGRIRKYVWEKRDWFAFSRLTANKFGVDSDSGFVQSRNVDLTLGTGYGRYINATTLAKAVRIEEHLLKENVIIARLPKETMIKIANIIEREDEYKDLYGEVYENQWFSDIEKEIKASGNLRGNEIGSIGILRIRQVLLNINERINPRYYGWDISAGALFNLVTNKGIEKGVPNFTLNGRYSYPIGWKMQLNSLAEISSPMNESFGKEIKSSARLNFIYELKNRINFITDYKLDYINLAKESSALNNLVSVSFLFYIENNIYIGVNGEYEKVENSPKRFSTSLTLTYNLY